MRYLIAVLRSLMLTAQVALFAAGCAASPDTWPQEAEVKDFAGTLGTNTASINCPTVVGFFGRAGTFLDSVGLICQSGSSVYRTEEYGTPLGESFSLGCPSGFIASGIAGTSGKHIVSLQLVCHSSTGSKYFTQSKGGSTGGSYDLECSSDQKLIGFNLQVVPYVNGIEPVCGPE